MNKNDKQSFVDALMHTIKCGGNRTVKIKNWNEKEENNLHTEEGC